MEIERINENTVKFYISYLDIEDRGFEREEIWYNRERSEQLFWEMMEEVNFQEDFSVEGPLWIQVQALEKGLEVIVTKAQFSKNGENIELPLEDDTTFDIPVDKNLEKMFANKDDIVDSISSDYHMEVEEKEETDEVSSIIVRFNDFEDVIQLSHYFSVQTDSFGVNEILYHYENKYYLFIQFDTSLVESEVRENMISQISEFAHEANVTIHLLEEYGKKVFDRDVFQQIKSIFPA